MSRAAAYLLVRAGGRRVGLALHAVVEVLQPGEVYAVPSPEPALRGVTVVRGAILPLVDLGALIAGTPYPAERGAATVVVRLDRRRLCLEVDEAEEVLRGGVLPVPDGSALPWAEAVARHHEGLVPLLDMGLLGGRIAEAASA